MVSFTNKANNPKVQFQHFRVARPVTNLEKSREMYCNGLGLDLIGGFKDHQGFSGCMLGRSDLQWHLEITVCSHHPVAPSPTPDDLLVFYIPEKQDWEAQCANMDRAGFKRVDSFNPYWNVDGVTFEDHDGYRFVIQNTEWQI